MSQIFKSSISGPSPPSVATSYQTDVGIAVPAANILNVLGGVGAVTSGSGNTITVTVTDSGIDWTDISTDTAALSGNGFFCTAALILSLPPDASSAQGDTITVFVDTSSTVTIQANTGESIQIGSNISVAGGTATSNARGSVLELVYRKADLTFHTVSSLGTWSVT